jgi:murein DD-endopeptidase MepM/ murein hydrolase activator NlpD
MDRRRQLATVSVFALATAISVGVGTAGAAVPGSWTRPVPGAVVRPFDPPRTPYGPGHRGVDFAAPPGAPVVAAGDGTVVFAGRIGPSWHVVVLHPLNGWRTGYSFLSSVSVRTGERVVQGEAVGASGGVGDAHEGTVVHFSLRIGDEYVDPMILFHPLDLGAVVHLAPTAGDRSGMGFAGPEPIGGAGPEPIGVERAELMRGLPEIAGVSRGREGARSRVRRHAMVRWRWY